MAYIVEVKPHFLWICLKIERAPLFFINDFENIHILGRSALYHHLNVQAMQSILYHQMMNWAVSRYNQVIKVRLRAGRVDNRPIAKAIRSILTNFRSPLHQGDHIRKSGYPSNPHASPGCMTWSRGAESVLPLRRAKSTISSSHDNMSYKSELRTQSGWAATASIKENLTF